MGLKGKPGRLQPAPENFLGADLIDQISKQGLDDSRRHFCVRVSPLRAQPSFPALRWRRPIIPVRRVKTRSFSSHRTAKH
jgi:hypothetical protein